MSGGQAGDGVWNHSFDFVGVKISDAGRWGRWGLFGFCSLNGGGGVNMGGRLFGWFHKKRGMPQPPTWMGKPTDESTTQLMRKRGPQL